MTEPTPELKPCPFCGGSATIRGPRRWAECAECAATGEACADEASAAAAWNQRVAPQPPAEAQPVATVVIERGISTAWHYLAAGLSDGEHDLYAHPPPSAPDGAVHDALQRDIDARGVAEIRQAELDALTRSAPSAPVGVERKYPDDGNGDDDAYNRGWNDCLDALAQQPAAVCHCYTTDPTNCIGTDDLAGLDCPCKCHAQQPAADPGACPACNRAWSEHRIGYSASACKMRQPVEAKRLRDCLDAWLAT